MALIEVERFGKRFMIDEQLKSNLDVCLKNTKSKNDNIFMVDGREGSGKSTGIGFACGYYLSGSNIKVVFTSQQFNDAYTTSNPGDTVIFDEFVTVGMSLQAMNKEQQNIIQMMTMSRKRLVNVILIVPNYFMFGWYFTTHRSLALIHVYTKNLMDRGYFSFYNREKMARMWFYGKKNFRVHIDKMANFHGRFPHYQDGFFFPDDEYQKAKDEAIKQISKPEKEEKGESDHKTDLFWKSLWLNDHIDDVLSMETKDLASKFGRSQRQWERIKKKLLDNDVDITRRL